MESHGRDQINGLAFSIFGFKSYMTFGGFQGIENFDIREPCYIKSKYSLPCNYYELPKWVYAYLFLPLYKQKIEQRGIVRVGFSVGRHVDRLNKFDMFEVFD